MDYTKLKPTKHTNLKRHANGTFYIFAMVAGRLIRKSLHTTSQEVALVRLNDIVNTQRTAIVKDDGKLSFGAIIDMVQAETELAVELAPNTKAGRADLTKQIKKQWTLTPATPECPQLTLEMDAAKITVFQLKNFSAHLAQLWSSSRYNHAIQIVAQAFALLVERGHRMDNPATRLKRLREVHKCPKLPSPSQFQALLSALERGGHRDAKNSADLVRFLAFTGCRKEESQNVLWSDIDWVKETIHVRVVKNRNRGALPRFVPMLSTKTFNTDGSVEGETKFVKTFLKRLHDERGDRLTVLPIFEAGRSIARACAAIGIPKMTHHHFRHYFATTCLESPKVTVAYAAHMLGHRDGGGLALKTYNHIREDQLKLMASSVSFEPKEQEKVEVTDQKVLWTPPPTSARHFNTGIKNLKRVTATGEYVANLRVDGVPKIIRLKTHSLEAAKAKLATMLEERKEKKILCLPPAQVA